MPIEPSFAPLESEGLLALPEDGFRHELIDGEHVVTASPGTAHQRVSMRLVFALQAYLEQHSPGTAPGELFAAPYDVVLSNRDVLVPDIVFVARDRAERVTDAHLRGAPNVVVEILSASTRRRDFGQKRERYERFGVEEYWIVDPLAERVSVLRLSDGRLRPEAELVAEAGDRLETKLLPGLSVPLTRLSAARGRP